MFLYMETIEEFEALAREFGSQIKQFFLIVNAPSLKEAERLLALVSD